MNDFEDVGLSLVNRNAIYVDPEGSDTARLGRYIMPVASLTEAFSLVSATRKTILVAEGAYAEAASLDWPSINGLQVIGLEGGVTISGPATTPVLTINPTFTSATFEAYLTNVEIEHTAQVGIEIDNAHMGNRKLIVGLDRVSSSQVSTGDSIHVTHTTAGQAIRIYAKGCDEIEGLVNVVTTTADDRFRFTAGCMLTGGLTCTGAIASEVTLLNSMVLTGGLTVNNATKKTYVGSVYRTDAGVYTELANAYSATL